MCIIVSMTKEAGSLKNLHVKEPNAALLLNKYLEFLNCKFWTIFIVQNFYFVRVL